MSNINLSKLERETIICFNEEESTASVYTHNPSLRRRLEGYALTRPDDCRLDKVTHDGLAVEYIVPKKWIKVNAPRLLTDEQRAALSERGRRLADLRRNQQ